MFGPARIRLAALPFPLALWPLTRPWAVACALASLVVIRLAERDVRAALDARQARRDAVTAALDSARGDQLAALRAAITAARDSRS